MTLWLKRSEAATEVQRARLERLGNNCAHPKEAVNASDAQALKSPSIAIATATCRSERFSIVTHHLILPEVRAATSEVSIPRIAACARPVPAPEQEAVGARRCS
jgi:hypothetical protein